MNTPTDSREAFAIRVRYLTTADDSEFVDMSIPERNELLDEIRRAEETSERLAEERRTGYWAIPIHVRQGLGLL